MGRTDQVLTGGSLSKDQPKNNHESRLRPSPRLSHTNLFCGGTRKYWQRDATDAAKGKTQRCPDGMSRRECKKQLKKKSKRMKKNRQRNPKKGGKGRKGQRTAKGEPKRKRPGKGRPKKKEEKGKGKNRKKNQRRNPNRRKSQNKGLNEAGSSSGRSGSGRYLHIIYTFLYIKTPF